MERHKVEALVALVGAAVSAYGIATLQTTSPQNGLAACCLWYGGLAVGSGLGLFSPSSDSRSTPARPAPPG